MANVCLTGRLTSRDLRVDFLPTGEVATHVQALYIESGVSAGTFKLIANGYITANITFSATIATLLGNINTALDTAIGTAGLLVATGADAQHIVLTAASDWLNEYLEIDVYEHALTGTGLSEFPISTSVTTQGAHLLTLSRDMSQFSYEETIETTDVTTISEFDANNQATKRMMTFNLSVYENAGGSGWGGATRAGVCGRFYVYPEGKAVDKRYFVFDGLLEGGSTDFPDHDKVERAINGSRKGKMVVPFDSIFAG